MFESFSFMSITHLSYIVIGVALTAWVAHTLRIHGRVFLAKGCKGNDELASSLSHLFTMGFYLLHIGALLLTLRIGGHVTNPTDVIELLSSKIGFVLVVLAVSHFTHIVVFSKIHGKPVRNFTPEPVAIAEVVEN
jgi:hypothetical protein